MRRSAGTTLGPPIKSYANGRIAMQKIDNRRTMGKRHRLPLLPSYDPREVIMMLDWITADIVTSTLALAGFYLFLYMIVMMWHGQLRAGHIVGVETLVFFLALDMAIATGRTDLSCFLGHWAVQLHNKRMIFAAIGVGTLLAILASSLLQAHAAQLEDAANASQESASRVWPTSANLARLAAWAIRAAIATCHTILLVGFAS